LAEAPDLLDHLDHRAYLADWFDWKKSQNPRFSHRLFARMTNQSSPSLLAQVIKGKRNLTAETTEAYVKALKFDREESEYFRLLVKLDAARTVPEKTALWTRIASTRRFQAARALDAESYRYLTKWYFVAVRELSLCRGFKADPSWIAKRLRPKVTVREAREAIELLTTLGLLRPDLSGDLVAAETTVTTPHEVADLAASAYHREMQRLSVAAMDRFEHEQRHVSGLTVAVPAELVPQLKREITQFQERILELCDSAAESDHVYQLCMQLFPLSMSTSE
jgi:uncharacterized protein (TIGR02147 family)